MEQSYKKRARREKVMEYVFLAAACMSILCVALICVFLFANGLPAMGEIGVLKFLSGKRWKPGADIYGIFPMILGSVYVTAGALLLGVPIALLAAVPFGIGSAIYLVEYAKKGCRIVNLVRVTTETLSGIPSIVYGLFGMLFFSGKLHLGFSMLSGAPTLAIMILPLIMRTTEEALLSVPDLYREGSFGLGAGRLRTVMCIVLPTAVPGILSGIILAIGRIVGETAALMYTSGTVAKVAGLFDSGSTLALHMYKQASEGLYTEQAYATSVILLLLVFIINFISGRIARRITKGR